MAYEQILTAAQLLLDEQNGGLTVDTVRSYKENLGENLTEEEIPLTKLYLLNLIMHAEKDIVSTSIDAIHTVYNDFDKYTYKRFAEIMREVKATESITDEDFSFMDKGFDNVFMTLAAKATLLRYIVNKRKNEIALIQKYSTEVKALRDEAKEKTASFVERNYYVDSY